MNERINKWEMELSVFGQLNSAIVLTGDIYDIFPIYNDGRITQLLNMEQYLCLYFKHNYYQNIIGYDMVRGFYDLGDTTNSSGIGELINLIRRDQESIQNTGREQTGITYTLRQFNGQRCLIPGSLEDAAHIIQLVMNYSATPAGLIIQFASQMVSRPDDLSIDERMIFLYLRQGAEKACRNHLPAAGQNGISGPVITNQMFLLTDKLNDLPAWFYMSFPQLKIINVEKPNYRLREVFISQMSAYFAGAQNASLEQMKNFVNHFVGQTEGFTYMDMYNIRVVAQKQGLGVSDVDKAIMLYKHGVQENPWTQMNARELDSLEEKIGKRVLGQEVVVRQAVDIIKRAVVGMSGLQHSGSRSKPRGIMFLAGPTGTGKTELAKAITENIFKDERNMIRFDMSEYREAQSDQRLLGAPPGYVGYEAGGQLTNAVREHPFSVLLFDEIEKAHPTLMDKFLQILEDGRITDGRGETVYFQNCLIVFTSNLGITKRSDTDPNKRVVNVSYDQDQDYETVKKKVLDGVRTYFNEELGRPEILNRIGNNILVFDFIRENVLGNILHKQIDNIQEQLLQEQKIRVRFDQTAANKIYIYAKAHLSSGQGGRGIGNVVEEKVLNPLARYIFDEQICAGEGIIVKDIIEDYYGLAMVKAERMKAY